MRPCLSLLVVLLALVSGNLAQADEPSVFEGKWKLTKAVVGEADISAQLGETVLEIKEKTYSVSIRGAVVDKGKLEIDATATPIKIDIISETPGAPPKLIAIGKVDGDVVTFAYRLMGDERPVNFDVVKTDQTLLVSTYERVK